MGIFLKPQVAGGVETFLELTDTPANYVGQGGLAVTVNVAENALEFTDSFVRIAGDTMTGPLEVQANVRIRGNNELRFYDNGNYVGFEAPGLAADQIWVLPAVDGAAGEALATDGGGVLSWGADHGALGELGLDQHPLSIITTPLATARNVIAGPTATTRLLAVQTTDDDTTNPLQTWLSSTDAVLASMGSGDQVPFFQINQAGGDNVITVDTVNKRLGVGIATPESDIHLFLGESGGSPTAQAQFTFEKSTSNAFQFLVPRTGTSTFFFGDEDNNQVGFIRYSHVTNVLSIKAILERWFFNGFDNKSGFGTNAPDATIHAVSVAAATRGVVVELAAAQSANAVEVRSSGGAATLWLIEHDGGQVIQQAVVTTGAPTPPLIVTSAAHTTLAAGVGRPEVKFDFAADQQRATGAVAEQPYFDILAPTMSFVGPSVVTDAMTVVIRGAPIEGANATINNPAAFVVASGNSGFGTTSPATSALLDLTSTTGALLLSRMTTAQRNALTAINGMIIYNSTDNEFNFYENGAWVSGSGLA